MQKSIQYSLLDKAAADGTIRVRLVPRDEKCCQCTPPCWCEFGKKVVPQVLFLCIAFFAGYFALRDRIHDVDTRVGDLSRTVSVMQQQVGTISALTVLARAMSDQLTNATAALRSSTEALRTATSVLANESTTAAVLCNRTIDGIRTLNQTIWAQLNAFTSTAFRTLLPIGTVLAFAGSVNDSHVLPGFWRLCDGSPQKKQEYPDLFSVIGQSYGGGNGDDYNFNLPDFRGVFLRGLAGNSSRDPDKNTRGPSAPGGNTGNNVGSVQFDALSIHMHQVTDPGHSHVATDSGHSHGLGGTILELDNLQGHPQRAYGLHYTVENNPNTLSASAAISVQPSTSGVAVQPAGVSTESRPINVAVNWIIRCI